MTTDLRGKFTREECQRGMAYWRKRIRDSLTLPSNIVSARWFLTCVRNVKEWNEAMKETR